MQYSFRFRVFGEKVGMFREGERGIVIEKEPQVVCVYGTDANYHILCAVPLCHPKYLKGEEYTIEFDDQNRAKVSVGELKIVIDYSLKKCASNKALKCFGSDEWGQDVQTEWSED